MEKQGVSAPERFKTPEEELDFLRQEVARKEQALSREGVERGREQAAQESVQDYRNAVPEAVLHETYQVPRLEIEGLALGLTPESHDSQISELLRLLSEKGIKNALSVAERLGS